MHKYYLAQWVPGEIIPRENRHVLSLARILASEVVAGGTTAVGFYAIVRISIGLVTLSLQ